MADNPVFSLIFGLGAAGSWASSDFSGGVASKRYNSLSVVMFAQVIGIISLIGLLILVAEPIMPVEDFIWGILGGISLAVAVVALYSGLATGRMGVVAPIASVISAIIPTMLGILVDGIPPVNQILGLGFAVISIWLVASSGSSLGKVSIDDLKLPLIAGLGFSLFRIFIAEIGATTVLWPILTTRIASVIGLASIAIITHQIEVPNTRYFPLICIAGIFDAIGGISFILATQYGRLDVASVFSSTQPAFTVVFALLLLKEDISKHQWIGLGGIILSIMLIVL
jgi:drug/metabolite transporter (DMT)-like permease